MARIHNLSGNAAEDSPHEVMVFDTETVTRAQGADELLTLRCWSAMIRRRHGRDLSRPRMETASGTGVAGVAQYIDKVVRTSPCLWVYAHNLSFDLATTQLPLHLIDLGWTITQHNLASDAPWAMLRKGGRSLRLVDSHSVLPLPLATIGAMTGIDKPALPGEHDPIEVWQQRCDADVQITMDALISCMDWWDEHQLGHWSITGAQTGWNCYRHLCVTRRGQAPVVPRGPQSGVYTMTGDGHVVIDPDPDARAFERSTLYQGRRDAWKAGLQPAGDYAELDMVRAHLSVACELPLPCRRGNPFENLPVDSPYLDRPLIGIIARVTLRVRDPRYPWRLGTRIIHPAGLVTTTLAGPEIKAARERGELVAIGAGWLYRLSYHMQPWALWVEQLLTGHGAPLPAAVRIMVKNWSRAVFGKWAGRTSHQVLAGTCAEQGWRAEHGRDAATGAPATILHMRGTMSITIRDLECDDSFPAVLSYIQSYVRVALSDAIETVGGGRMVACSTDSVTVRTDGNRPGDTPAWSGISGDLQAQGRAEEVCRRLGERGWPFRWSVKGRGRVLDVLSPQHVSMDGVRKYSGVPAGAKKVGPKSYTFHTWPKLGRQMQLGHGAGFVREARTITYSAPLIPRYVAADGCTAAPAVYLNPDDTHTVTAPAPGGCAHHGSPWIDEQYPGLVGGRGLGAGDREGSGLHNLDDPVEQGCAGRFGLGHVVVPHLAGEVVDLLVGGDAQDGVRGDVVEVGGGHGYQRP
jgi:hypothetical protein